MFAVHKINYALIYLTNLKTKKMDLQQIRKQLPIGADKEISKMANISSTSVRNVMNGLKTKPDIEIKVLKATAKFLKEYKEKKATAIQELQAVASA